MSSQLTMHCKSLVCGVVVFLPRKEILWSTAKSAHAEDREIYGDARFLEKEAGHVRLLGHLVGPRCCLLII